MRDLPSIPSLTLTDLPRSDRKTSLMNIYWFESFLTVMQGDIGDTVGGGWEGGVVVIRFEELNKQLSLFIGIHN